MVLRSVTVLFTHYLHFLAIFCLNKLLMLSSWNHVPSYFSEILSISQDMHLENVKFASDIVYVEKILT